MYYYLDIYPEIILFVGLSFIVALLDGSYTFT